jgi:hypothetical protein
VTVTVLNVDTGESKDYPTNQDGLYDTSSIVTGSYRITFTKDGFEKLVRGPITLEVGFTTVNAQLKVGSAAQQVEVTADVSLLQRSKRRSIGQGYGGIAPGRPGLGEFHEPASWCYQHAQFRCGFNLHQRQPPL